MKTPKLVLVPLASALIVCCGGLNAWSGITTTDPNLPPIPSVYLSPSQVHAMYSGPSLLVILSDIKHKPFALESRMPMGPDEQEIFNSTIEGNVSVNNGPQAPFQGSGFVTTKVYGKVGNVTGTFQTEILAMNLQGPTPLGPILIRESPTLPSQGMTSVTDIGAGMYHIDSFFDVFTELSIDGGQSWIPSTSSVRVNLVPEPASLLLLGMGLFGLTAIGRRRR